MALRHGYVYFRRYISIAAWPKEATNIGNGDALESSISGKYSFVGVYYPNYERLQNVAYACACPPITRFSIRTRIVDITNFSMVVRCRPSNADILPKRRCISCRNDYGYSKQGWFVTGGQGIVHLLSGTAGAATIVAFGYKFSDVERAIAFAVIVFVALIAGDMWRRATVSPENEKSELKRSIMSIGALYIVALVVTNRMDADIYGAAMTAVTVGAGGPLILAGVQSRVGKVIAALWGKE
jgi:hypothetical protein